MEYEQLKEEDLIEDEIKLEIEESAFRAPLSCSRCRIKMREVLTDFELPGGEFTMHISAYKCPKCRKEVLSGDQAEKLQQMLLLTDAIKDKSRVKFERSVNHDGKTFFIRFPKEITKHWNKKMITEIMPITNKEILIHLHNG